jgi:hypothetical protein
VKLDPKSVAAGIALLLLVKYVVIGLDAWDGCFHPGRIEPDSLMAFRKPLLTGIGDCDKCRAFWGGLIS